jgi:hypothetical protein
VLLHDSVLSLEVTVPLPPPAKVTVSFAPNTNTAVTVLSLSIVREQPGWETEQAPFQDWKNKRST